MQPPPTPSTQATAIASHEHSQCIAAKPPVDYQQLNGPDTRNIAHIHTLISVSLNEDPPLLKEAQEHGDWPHWKNAMDKEIE